MWISCNAGTSGCPTNCRQGQTTTPCRSAPRNRDPNLLPGQLHSTPNLSEYVCHAWRPQPGIASDLLEDDDTLRAIRPPPTDEDRSVLGAEEIAALFAARAVHYGHEDVMHHVGGLLFARRRRRRARPASCRGAGQRWKARRRKWRSTQPPWPPRRSRRRTMCPAAGAYARLYSPTGAPGRWCDDAGRDFGVQYASSSFTALRAPCRPTQSTHIGIPTRVSSV